MRGTVLEKIVQAKRERVNKAKRGVSLDQLKETIGTVSEPRGFVRALVEDPHVPALIAEIKKASPSKGLIRPDFDPVNLARIYESHGAACISVLTEEDFFLGGLAHMSQVRKTVGVPIIRKDFIFDSYQLYEARAHGADAVLLMASVCESTLLKDLFGLAQELGLDSLVEIHSPDELDAVLDTGARLVGINNRNLKTLELDLKVTLSLLNRIPDDRVVVTESGISSRADVERFTGTRVRAMLVGTSIMKTHDPGGKIDDLLGGGNQGNHQLKADVL